jgi:hypothetical protein
MPDLERLRAAARSWLEHIGDLDHAPVIVPFDDPEGFELRARIELAKVLRDELFEPVRHGPVYVWSGEHPLTGRYQHWGGADIWRCDEHPDWEGDFVVDDQWQFGTTEENARQEWVEHSMEAHAAIHSVEID